MEIVIKQIYNKCCLLAGKRVVLHEKSSSTTPPPPSYSLRFILKIKWKVKHKSVIINSNLAQEIGFVQLPSRLKEYFLDSSASNPFIIANPFKLAITTGHFQENQKRSHHSVTLKIPSSTFFISKILSFLKRASSVKLALAISKIRLYTFTTPPAKSKSFSFHSRMNEPVSSILNPFFGFNLKPCHLY